MSSGYDGSIRIDTRIDEKGFNKGIRNMGAGIERIGTSMRMFGRAIGTVVTTALGATIGIKAIAGAIRLIRSSFSTLIDLEGYGDSIRLKFEQLRMSLITAFQPLVTAALPYIIQVVDWMTRLLDVTQMVLAALFGQKEVMRLVEKDTKKTSGNMKTTEKSAKGALAAFDDINVLEKPDENVPAAGGSTSSSGSGYEYEMVPIDSEILNTVNDIKAGLASAQLAAWQLIWMTKYFVISTLNSAAVAVGQLLWMIAYFSLRTLNSAAITVQQGLWLISYFVMDILNRAAISVMQLIEIAKVYLKAAFENMKTFFGNIWTTITQLLFLAGWFFSTYVAEPIKAAFGTALDWIKEKWEKIFGDIKEFAKTTINSIIDFINGMIEAITGGLNAIIGGVNSIKFDVPGVFGKPGFKVGFSIPTIVAPEIPKLATGAVIPPNSEFLAVLGDQRSGTNIETPEALLRQIVREELGSIQADISIGFTGSLGALVRELKPHIDRENVRIGGNLVKGGAAL